MGNKNVSFSFEIHTMEKKSRRKMYIKQRQQGDKSRGTLAILFICLICSTRLITRISHPFPLPSDAPFPQPAPGSICLFYSAWKELTTGRRRRRRWVLRFRAHTHSATLLVLLNKITLATSSWCCCCCCSGRKQRDEMLSTSSYSTAYYHS